MQGGPLSPRTRPPNRRHLDRELSDVETSKEVVSGGRRLHHDDAEVSEALIVGPAPARDARRSSDASSGRQRMTASAPDWTQISGRALAGLDRKRFDVVDRRTKRGFKTVCVLMRLRE